MIALVKPGTALHAEFLKQEKLKHENKKKVINIIEKLYNVEIESIGYFQAWDFTYDFDIRAGLTFKDESSINYKHWKRPRFDNAYYPNLRQFKLLKQYKELVRKENIRAIDLDVFSKYKLKFMKENTYGNVSFFSLKNYSFFLIADFLLNSWLSHPDIEIISEEKYNELINIK